MKNLTIAFALLAALACSKAPEPQPEEKDGLVGSKWERVGEVVPIVNMQARHYLEFGADGRTILAYVRYDGKEMRHNERQGVYKAGSATFSANVLGEVVQGQYTDAELSFKNSAGELVIYNRLR